MNFYVISTSLSPKSKSRILAKAAYQEIIKKEENAKWIDLREISLPMCDGDEVYKDPRVLELQEDITHADGILIAIPVYNYNVSASAKNFLELMHYAFRNQKRKILSFITAAGGQRSYMSIMSYANSFMLDYRSVIVPDFVYSHNQEICCHN